MQRRLSQVSRISINLTGSMKDGTDSSSSSQDFGMFGQVELTANRIVCLERIGEREGGWGMGGMGVGWEGGKVGIGWEGWRWGLDISL